MASAMVTGGIGLVGVIIRRNMITVLMAIELMLNAVNLAIVAFGSFVEPLKAQASVIALIVMAVAGWAWSTRVDAVPVKATVVKAETGGGVIGRADVPAPRVEHPLGEPGEFSGGEDERHLPAAVGALARVPFRLFHVRPEVAEALGQYVTQPAAWPGVSRMADAGPLGLLGPVRAFRQYRSLEPAYPLDRHPGGVGDLLRRLSGTDPVLDLLGSQGTLHFDLVLSEPRELPSRDDPQPVIDRQREAPAAPRCCQDGIAAILTHRDQAQFLHRRPFCAADRCRRA